MLSQVGSIRLWSCVILALATLSFTTLQAAQPADLHDKSKSEDISSILEDELLFVAENKQRTFKPYKNLPPSSFNSSTGSFSMTSSLRATNNLSSKQSSAFQRRYGAEDGFVESDYYKVYGNEDELREHYLFIEQQREQAQIDEGLAREEERVRAERVKRQATVESCGDKQVDVTIQTSVPWQASFSDKNSLQYLDLLSDVITPILNSMTSSVFTAEVNDVWQGSTTISVNVTVPYEADEAAAASRQIARTLESLYINGKVTFQGSNYSVMSQPQMTNLVKENAIESYQCILCRGYQTCVAVDNSQTAEQVCQARSSDFVPFGINSEDTRLQEQESGERAFVELEVPGNIYIKDTNYRYIFVSQYGFVGFRNDGEERYTSAFDPRPLPVESRNLLCGFWAYSSYFPVNIDPDSKIWYHVYTKNDGQSGSDALLRDAQVYVELYAPENPDFRPTFLLVVTYEDMPPYSDNFQLESAERSTYQMLIFTDGVTTYAVFAYQLDGMLWTPSNVTIGYLDTQLFDQPTEPGNTGMPGLWFFKLGENPVVTAQQKCQAWYLDNLPLRRFYNSIDQARFSCPCSQFVAAVLNNWWFESIDNNVICYISSRMFGQYGKRCCYRLNRGRGGLIRGRSRGVAGSFLSYHPWFSRRLNRLHDTLPKQWCCQESQDPSYCRKYYRVRPIGFCFRAWIFIIVLGRGDPHINTMDGRQFAFNAIGEFTLFRVNNDVNFELQARTAQATKANGDLVLASVFSGFHAKGNSSDRLQVTLNREKTGLVVLINGQDFTLKFNSEGDSFQYTSNPNLLVFRSNNTLRASFAEGIELNITAEFRLLTMQMSVSSNIVDPVGLLGNMNGNPDDDYIFPNGTTLPNTTSEEKLLEYGKTWAVTDDTSLFIYELGQNTSTFTIADFQPKFWDNATSQEQAEAIRVCGGEEDQGCLYDYLATKDEALAMGTKQVLKLEQETAIIAANSVPELSLPESLQRLEVTVGQRVQVTFNATDAEDSVTPDFTFIDQPTGFSFTSDNQTAQWTPLASDNLSTIQLYVTDSSGADSEVSSIEIVRCSGCTNGQGTCNFLTTRPPVTGTPEEASCDCLPPYTGADCELEYDACQDDPCPLGTTCTDLSVDEHRAALARGLTLGYNCSDCPQGYVLHTADIPRCADIDECSTSNPCNQTCENSVGSFLCSCTSGYRVSYQDNTLCDDIDECTELVHGCQQVCVNTAGGYTCDCQPGFQLNSDSSTCTKDNSFNDTCQALGCQYGCINDSGSPQCFCQNGYTLNPDNTTCQDRNECLLNVCSQLCNNTEGSFQCGCRSGYELGQDQTTCTECPANKYGVNCSQTCMCRGRGVCDRVRGCVCTAAWTGSSCDVDVDECEDPTACPTGFTCNNNNGSFACNCPAGFNNVNNICTDIDECATAADNCDQTCVNTEGSFVCSCEEGYNYIASNNTCVDIDECQVSIDRCSQGCQNYPGSANCVCNEGFTLGDDRKTCIEELDPCEQLAVTKNCSYACRVENDAAQCYCRTGYQLAVNQLDCVDVLECDSSDTHQCSQNCLNTPGGYQCSCQTGFTLANDQRTCSPCDGAHWGDDCSNTCDCYMQGTERCDAQIGCVCKSGYMGATCQQDRDDCASSPCGDNSQCTDVGGSFVCTCNQGYTSTSDTTCQDENECDDSPCDQNCANSVGSYQCSCEDGFVSEGDRCVDVDECLSGPCQQLCRNTQGGFSCQCQQGFSLDPITRTTCNPVTECGSNRCADGCAVIGGVDECFCRAGFTRNTTDANLCDDVNECLSGPCINGVCTNEEGGFSCACGAGTKLAQDSVTCRVCESGQWGMNCANNCSCDSGNTERCEPVNGTCHCRQGWEGSQCQQNIDECALNASLCASQPNSQCIDNDGSYTCQCRPGFFTFNGACQACDDTMYGVECSTPCPCERSRNNTASCDDVSGECTCTRYWSGDNCTQDVDECTGANADNCGNNEVCVNEAGGFRCDCVTGYHRPSPGDPCTDLDECVYPHLNTCVNLTNTVCINTPASFSCQCAVGYVNSSGTCLATYLNFNASMVLVFTPTASLDNPDSPYYQQLADQVKTALLQFFRDRLSSSVFHGVIIYALRNGSLEVDFAAQIYNTTTNPEGYAARGLTDLVKQGALTVQGQSSSIQSLLIDQKPLTASNVVCDAYIALTTCPDDQECRVEASTSIPDCQPVEDEDLSLIIGLAVGLPLFFIVCLLIAVLVYICIKKRRQGQQAARDDHQENRFPSIFAGGLATKGSYGAAHHHQLYSPDNMSVSHASDSSGEGQLLKGRRGRPDFQDSPWYEQAATPFPHDPQSERAREPEQASNFSWEHMFRLLSPYREGFEIQRPVVSSAPQPPFTPQSQNPRHDSNA